MKKNTVITKISSIILIVCVTLSAFFLFSAYRYNIYINNFYDYFNNKDYLLANQYLNCNENFNLYKQLFLKKDLKAFSDKTVTELSSKIKNKTISELEVAQTLYELQTYNDLDSIKNLKNNLSIITTSKQNYIKADELVKDNLLESYTTAMDCLNNVSPYSDEYLSAVDLKVKTTTSIKELVFKKSNSFAEKNNYSKALDILDDYEEYLAGDSDINSLRESYSGSTNISSTKASNTNKELDEKTSSASTFLANISSSNMNSLGISSPTKYLIYVNLKEQKTYVFNGVMNKWKLEKIMPCSSGIQGYETPSGVFDITDRGDWFFSDKYNDGAKYWVQFKGNYLFHSLPFKEDKKTITDYTLGKVASHGCIRLSLDDAKWLYDNISDKTKVIIN